jgi:hypothetical protein
LQWKSWFLTGLSLAVLFVLFKDFRRDQLSLDHAQIPTADVNLTDRDKTYLDRYMDLTKWLTGISYALLAGLATKRVSEPNETRFVSFPCLLGVTLLVLSLVAGFLCYEGILTVMASEPIWKLRSDLTSFPVSAQLWLLALGTVSLAFAFFGSKHVQDPDGKTHDGKPVTPTAVILFLIVFLGLLSSPARLLARPTASVPTGSDIMSCVPKWEQSRGIEHEQNANGARKSELETELVMSALKDASTPPTGLPACSYVDLVLDKVKSDAASYVSGTAEVSVTGKKKQFTEEADFHQSGHYLVLTTPSITAHGNAANGVFNGQIMVKDNQQALKMTAAGPGQAPVPVSWTGQLSDSVNGAGKNATITWALRPGAEIGVPFDFYLDIIFSAGGAHFGNANEIDAEARKNFNDATAGLNDWMQRLWSTPKGLVSATSHSALQLQIRLDQAYVGTTPFTFPVSANVSHTLQLLNGSITTLQQSIQLKNGDLLDIVAP